LSTRPCQFDNINRSASKTIGALRIPAIRLLSGLHMSGSELTFRYQTL
jgi:hypothetical protein